MRNQTDWIKRPRKSKYANKKTTIIFKGKEVSFDSRKEAARAKELELLEKAGEIKELEIQIPFILQPAFIDKNGKKQTAIKYYADFAYYEKAEDGWHYTVEDVKSPATKKDKVYRLKKKIMAYNGYEIKEV